MKLTFKQMTGILQYKNFPIIRAIGFLYLRYTCPPNEMWKWFEPYLEDDEDIFPSSDKTVCMTVGKYCIKLLTDMSYFGTTLPRIPVPVERKFKVMLLLLEQKIDRRKENQ
jgi:pre-mRNA-splicing factor 38B